MTNEYISRDSAIIEMMDNDVDHAQGTDGREVVQILSDIPAADVAPVVHAYWIDTDNYYRRWRCSACSGHTKEAHPPFCPFCGAKMDAQGEE